MKRSLGLVFTCVFGLVACGGGGGGGGASVVPNPGGGSAQASQAKVTIVRAAAVSPSARSPKFIPATAQSIRIHVLSVNGGTPDPFFVDVIVLLSTLNPACTTLSNGGLSCSVTVKVPQSPGVVLQISAYNSTDGSGTPVAVVTTPPVDTTQPNPVFTASLGGVPAALFVTSAVLAAPADGATHALTFNVYAKDASGNLIMPPGNYPTPITPSITGDTNGALTLQTTSIAAPGATAGQSPVNISYNSAKALTSATVTLTSGTLTASVQINPLIFSPTSLNNLFQAGSSTSVSVSEANYTGAFALAGNGTYFSYICIPANCTPTAAGGSVSFMITPVSNGIGSFTIKDALSTPTVATIPFTITGQTGGGITLSNYKVITYALPAGSSSQPWGMAIGPDGKSIWFAEQGSGKVGRVDTTSCNDTIATPTCTIGEETLSGPIPHSLVSGNDGNIYVTTPAANTVQQVTLSPSCVTGAAMTCTVVPESTANFTYIPSTPAPTEIVRDPSSGSLYATDLSTQVGNIDPAGGTSLSYTFTGNRIVVPTPQPSPAPTPTPAPNPQFASVAFGGSGGAVVIGSTNLWVADNATNSIGNVAKPYTYFNGWSYCGDCGSVLNEFAGFNTGSGPTFGGMAFGPDGKLYVIEQAANAIAIVDTASCSPYPIAPTVGNVPICTSISHIPIPTSGAGAAYIVAGPDNNMWFTEPNTCKIGILNITTHVIHEISVPAGTNPTGLALGPDGNVWFTGAGSGVIGKVVP